jgi:atypical dual specificity phosphatase
VDPTRRPSLPGCADWIVEGQIAALPVPSREEMRQLREAGFGLVINLTEKPGPTAMAAAEGLTGAHLPLEDMRAPDLEQIQEFVGAVERALASGRPVAVHCMGGLGRTGTLIAAYLVHQGMKPWAAIDEVRRRRPGSIQTEEQEAAVVRYARFLRSV